MKGFKKTPRGKKYSSKNWKSRLKNIFRKRKSYSKKKRGFLW